MDEEDNKKLKEENAYLRQQLEEANKQIGLLISQNREITEKLNIILNNQISNTSTSNTKTSDTAPKRLADIFTKNGKSAKKRCEVFNKTLNEAEIMDLNSDGEENETINQKSNQSTSWADAVQQNDDQHNLNQSKKKPTPIQLKCYDKPTTNKIYGELTKEFTSGGYNWRQLNVNSPARIYCDNLTIKNRIGNYLTENNVEFNSFTDASNRLKAYIVRGLCHGDDDLNSRGIENTLMDYGITGEIKVTKFQTGNMKRNPDTASPLYKIILESDSDDSKIGQIKHIGSFQVNIQKMKRSNIVQCRRCQRFHHSANQCKFKYRCVQCIQGHLPGQCPRASNKNLPLGCVNCQEHQLNHTGHTANNLTICNFFTKNCATNNQSTKNTNNNQTTTKTKTQHTKQPVASTSQSSNSGDICDNTVANNPGNTIKKTRKATKLYRKNEGAGKSISSVKASVARKNPPNSLNISRNKNMNGLIAALMAVLQEFS